MAPPTGEGDARVFALALGTFHTCALTTKGSVHCWGDDRNGALGHARRRDIGDDELPSMDRDFPIHERATGVACGLAHSCAVLSSGDIACWGRWRPVVYPPDWKREVTVVPLAGAVQVTAGDWHTCALSEGGLVRCWGLGKGGALGYGNFNSIGDDEGAAEGGNVPLGARAIQVVAGAQLTCALTDTGGVRCWGEDNTGYPHRSRVGAEEFPSAAGEVRVGGPVKQLAAGGGHVCGILLDGAVRCWGDNVSGNLGYGKLVPVGRDENPDSVGPVQLGGAALQIAAGEAHTCALLQGGRVRCWGAGEYGRLGYGNIRDIGDDEMPSAAGDVDVGGEVVQLAAGGFHTCALLRDGCVRCWGLGDHGQLGYGNIANIGDDETPASAGCVSVF
jgi:alpha-tubulin suppressor-like RCC1 family protein